ncbi:MAG: ATP-binding protein [Rectinema sp.]
MRPFLERMLAKSGRLTTEQLRSILGELAEENGRLEAAIQSMLDGIVVCNLENIPVIVNKSAERILRPGPDSGSQAVWLSVNDEAISAFLKESLSSEETVLGREFAIDAPGGARIVAVSLSPLLSRGRIAGTLIHMEDITDKRRKESQLRRAESLASLTTLAAGVAHEIKNPLGSISIHIQLIKKALHSKKGADRELLERHLGVVDEEIERLNKIVVDFLFAVRPMDISLMEDDPGSLLKEIADLMRYEVEKGGVLLELSVPPVLPYVMMDRKYLKQALLNLVKNALAAMPLGGKLGLKAEADESEVRIYVSDTGMGIPEEQLAKIFEPYFTTKENGTGLGLTITFKIMKEHSGDITVRSKPGKGSTFILTIPVPQKEQRLIPWKDSSGSAEKKAEA